MIYTEMTKEAMRIAYQAHHGQVDKCGVPYIHHPYHVAEQMTDEITTCVALLHDVVEDTDVTLEQLEKIFPRSVTEAVALLTRSEEEDYFDYVRRVAGNPVAAAVKMADLNHNSDPTRSPSDPQRLEKARARREKYEKAKVILAAHALTE